MVIRAAALAAALALAGCGEKAPAPPAGTPAGEEDAAAILRKFPAATSGGFAEPARTVIRDAAAWEAAWKKGNAHRSPVPKAPPVDFAKEMVAVAALGTKPTGGWSVEIVGARVESGGLKILWAERGPGDGPAAAVITEPWHAVVLHRSDLPVEWVAYVAPTAAELKAGIDARKGK
jgi:hypothetical protein